MVHYISVSCYFGHYRPSFLNKTLRFRDCLRPQVIKKGRAKGEVILAGGSLRQS
jgi:hypothetical protein